LFAILFHVSPQKIEDSIERLERQGGHEFKFVIDFATEQLNVLEAADMSVLHADQDFFFEQCFVLVRVLRGSPTVPDSCYHF